MKSQRTLAVGHSFSVRFQERLGDAIILSLTCPLWEPAFRPGGRERGRVKGKMKMKGG